MSFSLFRRCDVSGARCLGDLFQIKARGVRVHLNRKNIVFPVSEF